MLVCAVMTQHHFGVPKPLMLQTDISKKGLGVAEFQDGALVTFASEAITGTEQDHGDIEYNFIVVF